MTKKTQVYMSEEELKLLRKLANDSGTSIASCVREAVARTYGRAGARRRGPVALWDGEPKVSSEHHDAIYDRP